MIFEVDKITGEQDDVNGLFDFDRESEIIPCALHRLVDPGKQRDHDYSGMGPGFATDDDGDDEDDDDGKMPEPALDNRTLKNDSDEILSLILMTADFFQENLLGILTFYLISAKSNVQKE